jgi:plastocyanin
MRLITFIIAAALALPAAAGADTSEVRVAIDNFAFAPQTITVPVGATVVWVNRDDEPHSVVGTALKDLHSAALDTNESYRFTFTSAGEYAYFCSLHPHMTAKVIVQ